MFSKKNYESIHTFKRNKIFILNFNALEKRFKIKMEKTNKTIKGSRFNKT